ncbi:high affinity copper uptake protein 1-like [Argonauta hians]
MQHGHMHTTTAGHNHHMHHDSMDSNNTSMNHNNMGGGMNHHGMGGGMHHMGGMAMSFHTGYKETILFDAFTTEVVTEFIGACVAVFILSILYEGLKVLREKHMKYSKAQNKLKGETIPSPFVLSHLVQSLFHIIQMVVSYFLMLIFMTYNVWLCVAVALGAGAGYFAFRWRKPFETIEDTEHCT